MSSRENPIILRQGFTKLWPNNIFLPEEKNTNLQFISLFKLKLATEGLMHYRYHRIISHRTNKNSLDFDEYLNIYKYQKNAKKRRTRLEKSLTRKTKNL